MTEAEYDARFPLSPEEEERLAKKFPSVVVTSKTAVSPPPPKQPKLAGKPSTSSGANAIIKSPGKVKVTPPARGKKVKKVVYEAPETLEEPSAADTSSGGIQEVCPRFFTAFLECMNNRPFPRAAHKKIYP